MINLDNARYNEDISNLLIEHFKEMNHLLFDENFMHIRCANHILNLIVKTCLKIIETYVTDLNFF